MTRKEALSLAMQTLSGEKQHTEAVEVLRTMREELPLNRWSDTAIRDAIEQFVQDHGRLPSALDFKKDRTLPPHTVIKNKYGENLSEWLLRKYPGLVVLKREARAAATERFVQEYHRLRPKSAAEYDKGRDPDQCCWYTIARYNETNTWRALLAKLELPVYSKVAVPEKKREYYVQFEADLDDMPPLRKAVLQQMVEERNLFFSATNFRIIQETDRQEPHTQHFALRYVTDGRIAYETEQAGKR